MRNKRIIVLMPEIIDPLDYEFLRGVQDEARAARYDVIVLCGIYNASGEHHDNSIYGQENIFSLMLQADADGIIFAAERFRRDSLKAQLTEMMYQRGLPCLSTGGSSDTVPNLDARQADGMYLTTKHLIEVHGCKNIWCITGIPDQPISMQRTDGYRRAMQEAGLPVTDDMIFYGYFWRDVPAQIGRQIADGTLPKPDGIVCASDDMAIGVMRALHKGVLHIPEDIAVTGYDGSHSAYFYPLTTVFGRDYQFGADAFRTLYARITGGDVQKSAVQQKLHCSKSCGCMINAITEQRESQTEQYIHHFFTHAIERHSLITTNYTDDLGNPENLHAWLQTVNRYCHLLMGWETLHICLCADWQFDPQNPTQFRQIGFSEQMICAVSKTRYSYETEQVSFSVRQLLPALECPHEPVLYVLTTLHHKGQTFGYVATSYHDAKEIDLTVNYAAWCDAVANGLNHLKQKAYHQFLQQQIAHSAMLDPQTGLPNYNSFSENFPVQAEKWLQVQKNPVLICLLPVISGEEQYDARMVFVHALKACCTAEMKPFLLSERVFGVLMPRNDDSFSEAVRCYMHESLGNATGIVLPEILCTVLQWDSNSLPEAPAEIHAAMEQMTHRAVAVLHSDSDYREQLLQLRSEILRTPQENWSVDEVARRMNMSRSHLQRLYRQFFDTTCLEDIITARMEKAKQLLACTHMRVGEIADACGYQNDAHFMRQFKEKIGMTAKQYRLENQQ